MSKDIVNYDAKWAADAKAQATRLKPREGAKTITTAGGVFKLDDEPIEGNALCVVVLDAVYANAWYKDKWEAGGEAVPPTCFALAHDELDLAPHPSMEGDAYFDPQNGDCQSCPLNQFGSADTGKGKACKNRLRLALIPAGVMSKVPGTRGEFEPELIEDEEHYAEAELTFLNVPPTSIKAFKKFVQKCADDFGRPPYGLVTRIDTAPMGTGGFSLTFEVAEEFPQDFYETLSKRHAEASDACLKPYSAPDPDAPKPTAQKASSRLKGLRKK